MPGIRAGMVSSTQRKQGKPAKLSASSKCADLSSATVVKSHSKGRRRKTPPSPRPAPILLLPPEIVHLILDILDRPDQNSLNRANKWLYSVINPVIYARNVRSNDAASSCIFWAAEHGQLGTLKHALAAGANLEAPAPLLHKRTTAGSDGSAEDSNDDDDDDDANVPINNTTAVSAPAAPATGAPPQARDERGVPPPPNRTPFATPLHLAVKHGHSEVVAWLLDNGVDINAPSYRLCDCQALKFERSLLRRPSEYPRWRPLHTAMCAGERIVAELLIHRGASRDLDATPAPGSGVTALHGAAATGMVPIIKLLALEDVDLDVNQRDRYENTALHYVSELYSPRDSADIRVTITKLLALGADMEAPNDRGHTPLLNACFRGNFAVAHRLVSIGANAEPHRNIRKFRDIRPLYFCALPRHEFFELDHAPVKHDEFELNRLALIKALVENGARVDARYDKRGHREATALMFACELAEPRVVSAFIQCGASVNSQDRSGRTPLYYACSVRVDLRSEVPQIACALLHRGARMDLEEEPNCSPLDWAVMQVRWTEDKVLQYMLRYATGVNVTKPRLKAALRKCSSSGNHKALKMLLHFTQRFYGITDDDVKEYLGLIIEQSDPWNQVETFETMLNFGRPVYSNEMLLLMTIQRKNRDLSLALLTKRFVSVSQPRFQCNLTFLHLACQWGDVEVVRELLERGADVDVFDLELRTPLSMAVTENHPDVALALMKEAADPHIRPSEDLLKQLFCEEDDNDDEDEEYWRMMTRNYLTAFDLAIRDSRESILDEMLMRFALPEIPSKAKSNYIVRACQNPNTRILESILCKDIDQSAAARCLYTMLRDIWNLRTTRHLCLNHLEAAKLLVDRIENLTDQIWHLIAEIAYYNGCDQEKHQVKNMLINELRIRATQDGREPHLSLMMVQRVEEK